MHSLPALSCESMRPHHKLIESRDGSSWPVGIKGAGLELGRETVLWQASMWCLCPTSAVSCGPCPGGAPGVDEHLLRAGCLPPVPCSFSDLSAIRVTGVNPYSCHKGGSGGLQRAAACPSSPKKRTTVCKAGSALGL